METAHDRLAAVDRVLNDLPSIHPKAPGEVWSTSTDCYRFVAEHCPPGARTLETGLGVSTVLFALWGAEHRCIVPEPRQVARCIEYCRTHEIALDRVRFEVGFSWELLPTLEIGDLDLYLIDGGHAFPDPVIDWFYGAKWLRSGGLLIIDDLQMPAVVQLSWFLDNDPRWTNLARTEKWAAYRREGQWRMGEPATRQPFFTSPAPVPTPAQRLRRVARKIYRSVSPRKPPAS